MFLLFVLCVCVCVCVCVCDLLFVYALYPLKVQVRYAQYTYLSYLICIFTNTSVVC